MKAALLFPLALAATLGLAGNATAQIGASTDIITGVVSREGGVPIPNAEIAAYSLETQITRRARTDGRGRFTLIFPDGGGQYRMTARAIGLQPFESTIQRLADEDRMVWNVVLTQTAITLEAITVRPPPSAVRVPDLPTPGSTERALNPGQIARLPIDATDINILATLIPGVVSISATDSTGMGYSIGGLRPDANGLTIDGLSFGSATSIPQEGLRNTRVVTSTYDVARGQFSGGLIASSTRPGTNVLQGTSNLNENNEEMTFETGEASPFSQGRNSHRLGAGLGGPIFRDRLFLFASGNTQFNTVAQQTLLSATPADLTRLGVSPDSVSRFLSALQTLGISPTAIAPQDYNSSTNYSGLARIDYLVSNSHTLTLRGDWRHSGQDPASVGAMSLPQTGGVSGNTGGGGMLTLTSRFGVHWVNEARAYLSGSRNNSAAFLPLPAGRVQIASALPDGTQGVTSLSFGGNTSMPRSGSGTNFEMTNEASLLPGFGSHRFKVGGLFSSARSNNITSNNLAGTFTFNSIADLEQGRPATFRRTLAPRERSSQSYAYAVYAGDVWSVVRPFQLTYGVRLEGSTFGMIPEYNPAVDSAFGRRTDQLPKEWHLSPRAGFSWTIGGNATSVAGGRQFAPARFVIRGGAGEFRSPMPTNLVSAVQTGTGLSESESQIVCTGAGVPVPAWTTYGNLDSVPDACLAGGPGPVSQTASRNVTIFGNGYEAPRAWRASLAVEKPLTQLLRLSVNGTWARGVSQYGSRDLNLDATPQFTLANEGNRPVYVPAADIPEATGAVRFQGSRVDPAFGQVLEIRSDLVSQSEQLTVSLSGFTRRGLNVGLSYTWSSSRDQASNGLQLPSTAADPNVREWAVSDFERRHSFQTHISYPFGASLDLTGIGRVTSGTPFTPVVGNDINGDGAGRNDRAFIFASGAGSPEAEGMGRLLETSSSRIRSCLERQTGTVAGRNTCRGPWTLSFDLQLNWRPTFFGLNRRLSVSLATVNLLRGVDELVHKSENVKGWGFDPRPDPTLLYVTGFDAQSQQFQYAVNERFGATGTGAIANRSPFQVSLRAGFQIGPDRQRAAIDALRGGGRGGGGGGGRRGGGPGGLVDMAASGGDFTRRLNSLLPNSAGQVLELKDSLKLTAEQVVLLEGIRDTLDARNKVLADTISKALEKVTATGDPQAMMNVIRPHFEKGRANVQWALEHVREILTAEQWAKLPPRIIRPGNPGRQGGPGQPGQGGQGPPRRGGGGG